MTTVAFDVDGTLISENDLPRLDIITMLRHFCAYATVIVWSGGGIDYARQRGRDLDLPANVQYWHKGTRIVDICFDDQYVGLGIVNVKI